MIAINTASRIPISPLSPGHEKKATRARDRRLATERRAAPFRGERQRPRLGAARSAC
jgi:hypothetical protein